MIKYIAKRVGLMVITVLIVLAATFLMMQWMPGTPFTNPKLTPEQIAGLRAQYGLDKPIWEQFISYMINALQFNFGQSFVYTGQQVSTMLLQRLPVSAQLGFQALIVGIPLGVFVGTIQAVRRNTKLDYTLSIVSLFFTAIPSFLLGMLLLYVFAFRLAIFPISGWDTFSATILPTLALSLPIVAAIARFSRAESIETLNSDQIQLAYAKGLTTSEVVRKHTIRNSLIPVLTLIGPLSAQLLTGSALVETLFSIPGIGNQFVGSITSKDFPVIMATTFLYTLLLQVMILIGDIITAFVDPRIRLEK